MAVSGSSAASSQGGSTSSIASGSSSGGPPRGTLAVILAGDAAGAVTSIPPGIDCPAANCQAAFPVGTGVTLVAQTAGPGAFRQWVGTCTGSPNCGVQVVDGLTTVQAVFSVWHGNREVGVGAEGGDLNEATGIVYANGVLHVAATLNFYQAAIIKYSTSGDEVARTPVVKRDLTRIAVFPDGTSVIAGHDPNNSTAELIGYSGAGTILWSVPLGRQADSFTPALNQDPLGNVWVGTAVFPGGWSVFQVDALGYVSASRGGEVGDNANRFSDFVVINPTETVIAGAAMFGGGMQRPFVQRAVFGGAAGWTYAPTPTDYSVANSVALDSLENSYVTFDARPVELVKFNASGQEAWRRTIPGGVGGPGTCALQIDLAFGFLAFSAGPSDVYAYDLDGNLLWSSPSGARVLYGVAIDDDGYVYAAGWRYEGAPTPQNKVAIVAKFDRYGNRL